MTVLIVRPPMGGSCIFFMCSPCVFHFPRAMESRSHRSGLPYYTPFFGRLQLLSTRLGRGPARAAPGGRGTLAPAAEADPPERTCASGGAAQARRAAAQGLFESRRKAAGAAQHKRAAYVSYAALPVYRNSALYRVFSCYSQSTQLLPFSTDFRQAATIS